MLGLLGILGAAFAGLMADGILSSTAKTNTDDDGASESEHNPLEKTDAASVDLVALAGQADAATAVLDISNTDSSDTPAAAAKNLLISGDDYDDILTGQAGADTINGGDGVDLLGGRDGDDLINGDNGDDYIDGGAGADTLLGGAGNDVVQGNGGNDHLVGGTGDDSLAGHMDDDHLQGDQGDDTLLGGSGGDTLEGGAGADWVAGGYGHDVLMGGEGQNTLDGGAGNDTLWGFDSDASDSQGDFLNGGIGDDTLMIGAGDYANGGEGADTFAIGDWIGDGDFTHITDYNPIEDEIIVLYDAMAHPDPHIELITEEGSDDATVLLDGIPLAIIMNGAGLSVDALSLMPSTSF